jgi:hypothetical protein
MAVGKMGNNIKLKYEHTNTANNFLELTPILLIGLLLAVAFPWLDSVLSAFGHFMWTSNNPNTIYETHTHTHC